MTETSAYWLARTIAALIGIIALLSWSSVDSGKPATDRRFKTGHHERAAETSKFYFVPFSTRKSVCSFVRQLRGPHLSTCA
jgi:hypothetical protein